MNVAIFGLGYVGLVNMVCLSKLGHKLTGVDIKAFKVDMINAGETPIYEPEIKELLNAGISNGTITATVNPDDAIRDADVVLICVGTPSKVDGEVNLGYTINTTLDVCNALKSTSKKIDLVYRSTIPPNTVEEVLIPEIQNNLGQGYSNLVSVSFLPEFLREGTAVSDFFNGARTVIGNNDGNNEKLVELFSFENSNIVKTDIVTAEFVKYVDNGFHALKVAFANEIYALGSSFEIDTKKANEVFLMDNTLNISKYYLKPGLPFGGSCLPKDLRAIYSLSNRQNIPVPLMQAVTQSNVAQQERLKKKVLSFNKKNIALYGISFKNDTDDVRESPLLQLAEDLITKGVELTIYDPHISLIHLRQTVPSIVKYITDDKTNLLNAELLLVAKKGIEEVVQESTEIEILNLMVSDITLPVNSKSKVHLLY